MGISKHIRTSLTNASLIRRVADEGVRMRQDGKGDVLDLSLGNPTIEPPRAFQNTLQKLVHAEDAGTHRYMNNNGFSHVRQAVAKHLAETYDIPFSEQHISMAVGAAGGINTVLKSLLDPGDEVMIFSPYFVEYGFYIGNHGGKTVIVPSRDDFQIDLEAVERALTPQTKAIMLNTPNNPTGVVYTEERLRGLSELLHRHRKEHGRTVYIINDSPYRRLVYGLEQAPEPLSFYEHSILVTSYSKDLAIPGERIGFVAFSPECEDVDMMMEAMAFSSRVLGFVNAPALMQRALPFLLDAMIDIDWYQRKRDALVRGLRVAGFDLVVPEGAFYLYPKAPGGDDVLFFEKMKEKRVLVVPGSGFGTPGYFRIAYCSDDAIIEQALPLFKEVADALN